MPFESIGDRTGTDYQYIEMQDTETYQEPRADEPYLFRLFSALIIPVALFALLVWALKRSQKVFMEQKAMAEENIEVLKLNNELLKEQIQLQRETLEAFKRKER